MILVGGRFLQENLFGEIEDFPMAAVVGRKLADIDIRGVEAGASRFEIFHDSVIRVPETVNGLFRVADDEEAPSLSQEFSMSGDMFAHWMGEVS